MQRLSRLAVAGICGALVLSFMALASAQEQGSFGSLSWGPSGIPGLSYTVGCSAFGGPAWTYRFRNTTARAIAFRYSFARESAEYSHTVVARGSWRLRHVAPLFPCSTSGPLRLEPQLRQ